MWTSFPCTLCITITTIQNWKKPKTNILPGLVLLNNDAGSKLAQPGVSAIPMRHSLLERVKENKDFFLEWNRLPNIYSWEK